jgi:hypothetical protein
MENVLATGDFASALRDSVVDAAHQELRELTAKSTKPAAESSFKDAKDVALKLLNLIEAWSQDRTSFWTELSGQGEFLIKQRRCRFVVIL